ncbi:hypothetical protein RZO50_09595 [Microbacterium sp. SSW1-59]|uniref:hypothetical protein n=1 Tax=Microbacterium xanthum TaxID=3079794 RepID=UPI002AD49E36|nr:hypothetical protein [Microbacterium sp. SSW1-59]MDZ8201772.1 hypothetical protein [Microbacterium sp. SSW1-59]
MSLDPDMLLDGPRGRRLCLQVAMSALDASDTDEARDTASTVWWVIRRLDPAPGTLIGDVDRYVIPDAGPAHAARVLSEVSVPDLDELEVRRALADSVSLARYWQELDGGDMLAARPEMRSVLARVADAVAATPWVSWWESPIAAKDQWVVQWDDHPFAPGDPRVLLAEWRREALEEEAHAERERPRDPTAMWGGTWWSTPPYRLVHTTRSLAGGGASELWHVEDSLGWESATIIPVAAPSHRVYEIDGVQAWVELCRQHPLSVTASRRHEWFRVTGRDGAWVQPDWAAVARKYDGVHLTVAGYLTAATQLIDVGDDLATIVAGWAPDSTYWFVPVSVDGASERWRDVDTNNWRRV